MNDANLFKEDNDFNICKSWLCNLTNGKTYSLSDWFWSKVHLCPGIALTEEYYSIVDSCFSTQEWDDAIGYRHDFKVDGEDTDEEAEKMVNRLNAYVDKLNTKIDALKMLSPDEMKTVKSKKIERIVHSLLSEAVSDCYVEEIVADIKDDVIKDVNETASPERWSIDDVLLAIGRVLYKRLNIEI